MLRTVDMTMPLMNILFHFMGKSGKFFPDQDGNWRVQSNDNLEVIYDYNDPSNLIGSLLRNTHTRLL